MEVIEPLRVCRKCDLKAYTREDLEMFSKDIKCMYQRQTICKVCKRLQEKENKYGITGEEYKAAMSTSDSCEICGVTSHLCYDHDHNLSGIEAFRGVLCRQCNKALGLLGDNQEGAEKALKYFLTRSNSKS